MSTVHKKIINKHPANNKKIKQNKTKINKKQVRTPQKKCVKFCVKASASASASANIFLCENKCKCLINIKKLTDWSD